ncbi:hypothetical protein TNCV_1737031, partial [Trichonephila clavipes]
SAAYQCRSAECLAFSLALGLSTTLLASPREGVLPGQRKGSLPGRVCGRRVRVVGDLPKERSCRKRSQRTKNLVADG